jgi:3-deoxy-manno-octulosonate cytidylyltransferase (CMP-KDO synthetase)
MNSVIIIPARIGSTRFPKKPLASILGKPLLERTWRIAKAVKNSDRVVIATDSEEILQASKLFGAEAILTPNECENGTLRTWAAVQSLGLSPNIVINLQGDAVLTPPWVIEAVIDAMDADKKIQIATPATRLTWSQYDHYLASKECGRASGTLVVFDQNRNALYFSKGAIPFVRHRTSEAPPIHRHIGIYGYRMDSLQMYSGLAPTPLEQMEGLEQLRALENSIPIRIVPVNYKGRTHWSIDNPSDIQVAESIIKAEGELLA